MSLSAEFTRADDRQSVPNELFRILERRIILRDFYLCQNRGNVAGVPCLAQRVLERLLQHVSDPTRCGGDQDAKRQRGDLAARLLIAMELITHLWAVAVDDDNPPTIEHEIDNWTEALTGVSKLVGDRRPFAWRRQGVAPNGDDCGAIGHRCAAPINAPSESYAMPNALRSDAASAALIRLYRRVTDPRKVESIAPSPSALTGSHGVAVSSRATPGAR